jgi:Flp pilus assembly protein TadB
VTTSQLALVAACCALVAAFAVAAAVREARGRVPDPAKPGTRMAGRIQRAKAELPAAWQARWRALVTASAVAATIVWGWTGWPIHGLLAGAAVLAVPFVLTPGTAAQQRIERLEALGQWLNHLAGIHTAGVSLTQTIAASAKNPPAPIAPNVRALAERLRARMDGPEAFARFADELADGVVDHVMLLLQSHAANQGPGLTDALEALAANIHRQASEARDVEADRAKVRKSSRQTSCVILVVVTGCMLNEAWSAWYQTPLGQIVLAVLGGFFAWTLLWLRRIARTAPDPRLLDPLPAHPHGGGR